MAENSNTPDHDGTSSSNTPDEPESTSPFMRHVIITHENDVATIQVQSSYDGISWVTMKEGS